MNRPLWAAGATNKQGGPLNGITPALFISPSVYSFCTVFLLRLSFFCHVVHTSRCLTFLIVYALGVCQNSDRYTVLTGILPEGQNIKTTEIKPMAYINPYMNGGDNYEIEIRGKPKRRS